VRSAAAKPGWAGDDRGRDAGPPVHAVRDVLELDGLRALPGALRTCMSARAYEGAGIDVVPLWYHIVVAMNLRLDDQDSALLKALAEAEHVSLHEAALRAIRRSARELAHTDRVREATAEMLGRWGEVLDKLGRA
jgi:hypothetical protein